MDNNAIEEPKPQSSEETSSSLKGNLSSEKNPQYSYQAVLDLAPTFPKWKETPRNVSYNQILAEGHSRSVLYHSLSNIELFSPLRRHSALSSCVQRWNVPEPSRENLLPLDAWDVFAGIGNPKYQKGMQAIGFIKDSAQKPLNDQFLRSRRQKR